MVSALKIIKINFVEIMTNACKARYNKLVELTTPLNESDIEEVVDGLIRLSELLTEEIELDVRYFKKPFRKDVDIVRVSSETYLKSFVAQLENEIELLTSDVAIQTASRGIFTLYKKLRVMDEQYGKLIPGYVFVFYGLLSITNLIFFL
jgi:Asp-tRNA(Asn)/Glu-tRNA(Gln) amidotransferase C subunit